MAQKDFELTPNYFLICLNSLMRRNPILELSLVASPNYPIKDKFGTFISETRFVFSEGVEMKISKQYAHDTLCV